MYGPVFNYSSGNTMGVGQSSESNSTSPFSKPYSTSKSEDTLEILGQGGEKKKSKGVIGAVTDFGKGIVKGAYNAVASLFTVKGMLMALGTVALVAVAPAVAIPLLVAGGVVMGGTQVAKGVSTGDWEKAGEGTFTLGATMLGAKFGPKTTKGAGDAEYAFVKTSKKDGVTTTTKQTGMLGNTWANIKSVFGGKMGKLDKDGNVMTTADGKLVDGKNIYQLTKEKFSKDKSKSAASDAGKAAVLSTEADSVETAVTSSSDGAKPMTRREQVLARIEQRKANEQATMQSKGTRLVDESGVTHNIKGVELKRIRTQADKIGKEVQEAHANAKDYEESGYLGSLGTTPEKVAQAQAKAKAEVLGKYEAQLNDLTQDLSATEKQQFRDLIGETDEASKATFKDLLSKAGDKAVERMNAYGDVAGQQALRHSEISALKDLQQRKGPLTEADTATLKALEEKYSHRTLENVQKRRDIREMETLHREFEELNQKDLKGNMSEASQERLSQLREAYPEQSKALFDQKSIERVHSMRQDFAKAELPSEARQVWADDLKLGQEHFNKELDIYEFECLKSLKGNKTYEFTSKDMGRYNELETSLKGRLQKLDDEWDPNIFNQDVETNREMNRLKDLVKPQETVNPTAQEQLSLKELDTQSFQNKPRVEGLPQPATKPTGSIADDLSLDGDDAVRSAPSGKGQISIEEYAATHPKSVAGLIEDEILEISRKFNPEKPVTYEAYNSDAALAKKIFEDPGVDRLANLEVDGAKFQSAQFRGNLRHLRELRDNKTVIVDNAYTEAYGKTVAALQERLETLQRAQNGSKNADAQKEIAELQELLKSEPTGKKWFSGFTGPHGTGQILSANIAGAMGGDEPSE